MPRPAKNRVTAIIDAAREVFEHKGFESATIDEITARAKVSKGLAYHYFKSKDDILGALIKARLDELDDLVVRLRTEPRPKIRLRLLVDQLVDDLTKGEDRQRFLITTFLQKKHNKLVAKAMRESPDRFASLHDEELRLLADLGCKSAEAELPLFRATLQGMVMLYLLNPAGFPLQATAELFITKYQKEM